MKKMPWYLIAFTVLGLGIGLTVALIAAYGKAYLFGGIEEETVGLYLIVFLLIFLPAGFLLGKWMEDKSKMKE